MFPDEYHPTDDEIARVDRMGLLPSGWLPPSKRPDPKSNPG